MPASIQHLLPIFFCLLLSVAVTNQSRADNVLVAVASNFNATMQQLIPAFYEATGHSARVSYGSTGKLFAQISHGAPYEVFLSADNVRTQMAIQAGFAVPESTRIYAIGRLSLWSADEKLINQTANVLKQSDLRRVALANPKTAPYGTAAMAVLEKLGLTSSLAPKLVWAESVAQVFQFVATGNAEVGFIALSQLRSGQRGGSSWLIPAHLHPPVVQEAVLLKAGKENAAAHAFIQFLTTSQATIVISRMGYQTATKP